MLREMPNIYISPELYMEWQQLMDEGHQVQSYEQICKEISKKPFTPELKEEALRITKEMQNTAIKSDFKYEEPSDLQDIKKAKPQVRHQFHLALADDALEDKILGAWVGRISGCLLGKPIESIKRKDLISLLKSTDNYPMKKYICDRDFNVDERKKRVNSDWYREELAFADNIHGIAPIDDDTNYTVLALKVIEKYGIDFKPDDVLEAWLSWIPMFTTFTAERTAYRNAIFGMLAPETATYANPCREWIGAQIRGDFFGYINPANPEKAAELAWRDASISHVKNGIYGEMFIAAMLAAACVCDDINTVIEAGLDEIPEKCRLREAIECVMKWHKEGVSSEQVVNMIHERYNEYTTHHWCHTISNAMIVIMALLYGEKDYGKTICLAVQAAFDTDCNGATAGSILGMMIGFRNIPEYWYSCYNMKLKTSIDGYFQITAAELAKKTFHIINM